MRNYIILNGTNSNTISGLLIQQLAPISKPLMRTEVEEIDGRDGDIVTPLGFSAYDKDITIGLYGTFDINAIIAFFNSEGTVVFSNEPDKYYNYQITAQIDFERLVRYRTATVTFHCQPFKFATTGETQTLNAGEAVSGEGSEIVLDGTAEAPFNKLDLKGNIKQQTYSGKNLACIETSATKTIGGVPFTIDNGIININGTISTSGNFYFDAFHVNSGSAIYWIEVTGYTDAPEGTSNTAMLLQESSDDGTTWTTTSNLRFNASASHEAAVTLDSSKLYRLRWYYNSTNAFANATVKVQLESGSTKTDFEQYCGGVPSPNPSYSSDVNVVSGEQTVKITGKNLWGIASEFDKTVNTVVFKTMPDGSISANGTATNTAYSMVANEALSNKYIYLTAGTYTLSIDSAPQTGTSVYLYDANANAQLAPYLDATHLSRTFTLTKSYKAFIRLRINSGTSVNSTFKPMLMAGSTAEPYEPYQGQSYTIDLDTMELCKIGTYQDYIYKDGGKWYKHAEIGKVVLDGTEAWSGQNSSTYFVHDVADALVITSTAELTPIMSNYYASQKPSDIFSGNVDYGISLNNNTPRFRVRNKDCADSTALKTWLSTHNTTVYYALATPTDTEITDETLIAQLEAIASQAHAYRGRTHINAIATDTNAPHIIEAEVNGDASGTVTNAGNIYSKPKLTVYGSGDIGIYLNGVQMFQVALGSDGYITIDTNLMEAYKDNLQTLKNRQVTGDYSNFKLPVGANTISFSGLVSKCIVENFSRWL